jgi:hypothetical protein
MRACACLQNDSLRVELPVLLEDVDAQGLSLGNEAFNTTPEAVTTTHPLSVYILYLYEAFNSTPEAVQDHTPLHWINIPRH